MGEPVKFVNNAMIYVPSLDDKPEESLPKEPWSDDLPIKVFESLHWKVQTEMNGWMTHSDEDRMKKAKVWVGKKGDMNLRHGVLCAIIIFESRHPNGSSNVAAIAFRGLFPKHLRDSA